MTATTSKIGAHVSIAEGIDKAPARAHKEGCETFQCFTRPPQGGPAPALSADIVANFRKEMEKYGMATFYIHTPYYINLASLEQRIRHASIRVIREELERGSLLGARYIMTHVGSHNGQSLEEGIKKVQEGMAEILEGYFGTAQLLIEILAGVGSVIGDTFEEVGEIVRSVKHLPGFGGVCFDTCHAFASGYDFRTIAGAQKILDEFDKHIGLEFLKLTHVNDSKTDLGGKRDRHEHIGKGFIGKEGIASLLSSEPFKKIDWILETETDGRKEDIQTLASIRSRSLSK